MTMRERDVHRHLRYIKYIIPEHVAKKHMQNFLFMHFVDNGRALLTELHYGSPMIYTRLYREME